MSDFEDQLATAFVAKMAGMTLKQVDDFTTHSTSGPARRIDPTSFLTDVHKKRNMEKQQQVNQLHDLAEKMYPLPEPIPTLPPEPIPTLPPESTPAPVQTPTQFIQPLINDTETIEVLKSIDSSFKECVKCFKMLVNKIED